MNIPTVQYFLHLMPSSLRSLFQIAFQNFLQPFVQHQRVIEVYAISAAHDDFVMVTKSQMSRPKLANYASIPVRIVMYTIFYLYICIKMLIFDRFLIRFIYTSMVSMLTYIDELLFNVSDCFNVPVCCCAWTISIKPAGGWSWTEWRMRTVS